MEEIREFKDEQSKPGDLNAASWWSRLVNVFVAPSEAFESLRLQNTWRDWVIPIIILSILGIVSNLLVYDIVIDDYQASYRERIESSEKIPPDKKQEMLEKFEEQTKNPTRRIINNTLTPVYILISFSIMAAALWFVGNIILGGEAKFVSILSVVALGSLIDIVTTAVKVPIIYFSGTGKVYTGLGLFLEEANSFFYRFFVKWDLFTFWKIAVIGIGMAVIYRFSIRKGIVSVAVLWLVYVLIISAVQGIFGVG